MTQSLVIASYFAFAMGGAILGILCIVLLKTWGR